jgi:hypothetical protein
MPSWKQDGDRALEDELRAARPEPRVEVTQAIADDVRPRHSLLKRRIGRVQLVMAGGVAALALTPVVALSGQSVHRMFTPQAKVSAADAEYDDDAEVLICVNGFATHSVSPSIAATLVGSGVATYGAC